jgi:hypothetical protein
VVFISVAHRVDPAKGGSLIKLLVGYGWGNVGYGTDMSTTTAFLRVAFVNTVGILPVWAFLAWRTRWPELSPRLLLSFLPFLAGIFPLLVLRNYAGHHPWMTCHFILLGLVLSVAALKLRLPSRPAFHPATGLALLGATFVYATVMLAMGHKHDERQLALIHFIRDQTPRSATVVVLRNQDPEVASLITRLEIDRHYVVRPDFADGAMTGTNEFYLTTGRPVTARWLVHLDNRESGDSWMNQVLAWYSRTIAHRRPGDKVEVGSPDYFLYQP